MVTFSFLNLFLAKYIFRYELNKLADLDDQKKNQLKNLLDLSYNSTPFHSIELNILVSEQFSLDSYILLALLENEIQGFIIFHKKRGDTLITSPYQLSLITYGGPVGLPGNDQININLLKNLKRFSPKGSIYIKSGYKILSEIYQDSGYKVIKIPTLLIDTKRSKEAIWNSFDNRIRRNIKKAINNNIEVKVDNGSCLDQFIDVYKDVCERKGLFFHERDYYRQLYDTLNKDVIMSIYYAIYSGEIISVMSVLEYKDMINPWFGGTKSGFENTSAGSLIYWEILKYASLKGFSTFDFLGLDVGPVAFYKKGFGGSEADVCHASYTPVYIKICRKLMKMLQ